MKTTSREEVLVRLAGLMGLTVTATIALPTAIEVAARKMGMDEVVLVEKLIGNKPARDYIAQICRDASASLQLPN